MTEEERDSQKQKTDTHVSVLLHETIRELAIVPDGVYVDATLGGAGHAKAIAALLNAKGTLIGLDRDEDALKRAKKLLSNAKCTVYLREENFRSLARVLDELSFAKVHGVMMDLGLSSFQLEEGDRGFSFQKDEPLAMTFAKHPKEDEVTALDVVNTWQEEHLADILFGFGEERQSRKIAKAIVAARPLTTTKELADTVASVVKRVGRLHPATKTFQAIRMAVNDELGSLEEGLNAALERLEQGGRLAVISFHSIEDRVVKHLFKQKSTDGVIALAHKKPLVPTREEVQHNPRARSAKLRVAVKL